MTERGETPPPFTQTGNGANTLVFIHGFLDDSSFWQPTIQALEARNLSAVTIDLPGMGQAVRRRIICESFSAIYEWWRISLCSTIVCCRGLRPKTTVC
jgi:pimeloyl-ACP methyl ester carboxylesterase